MILPTPPDTRASLLMRLPDAADVAAWDELVSVYGPLVHRMGIRQGLQQADADDLVQIVLTSISHSVSGWLERSDRGKFRAWLLRVARNAAVNCLTRQPIGAFGIGGDDVFRRFAEVPAPASEISSAFDLEYRREVFRWAVEQVRETVAETTWQSFWLTQVRGISIVDASNELDISVANVYIGRSRVMSRLKELVKQFEEEI